ncbi:MAG: hypothetical protein ACE5F1_01260 [Planctomycetota bacterium]
MTKPPRILDLALILLVTAALYLWLGQETFYKVDGRQMVLRLAGGYTRHEQHLLYLPLLNAFFGLLAPLGLSPYRVALLWSALGTVAGLAILWPAWRLLGLDRRAASGTTLLIASCPAVVFFATVVELHGTFFAFACLATLLALRHAVQPSWTRAILLGAGIGLAYHAHATGVLLPALLFPWILVLSRERRAPRPPWKESLREDGPKLLLAAALLALLIALQPALAGWLGLATDPARAGQMLFQGTDAYRSEKSFRFLAGTLWNEWLRPCFPLAVLAVPALFVAARRPLALALHLGLTVYLAATCWVLGSDVERGAYLLPLVVPAALLCAASCRRSGWLALALAVSLCLSVLEVRLVDADPRERERWIDGIETVIGRRSAYLIVGSLEEIDALLIERSDVPFFSPFDWTLLPPTRSESTLRSSTSS